MKRISIALVSIIILILATTRMHAQAGSMKFANKFALGAKILHTSNNSSSNSIGIGFIASIGVVDNLRSEVEVVQGIGEDIFQQSAGLNLHYLVDILESKQLSVYPIIGIKYMNEAYAKEQLTKCSTSPNLGLGLQCDLKFLGKGTSLNIEGSFANNSTICAIGIKCKI